MLNSITTQATANLCLPPEQEKAQEIQIEQSLEQEFAACAAAEAQQHRQELLDFLDIEIEKALRD